MTGYNKQKFVEPYTVKFKIIVNKYYSIIEYKYVVQFSCMSDAPKVLAIYWETINYQTFWHSESITL